MFVCVGVGGGRWTAKEMGVSAADLQEQNNAADGVNPSSVPLLGGCGGGWGCGCGCGCGSGCGCGCG